MGVGGKKFSLDKKKKIFYNSWARQGKARQGLKSEERRKKKCIKEKILSVLRMKGNIS
ncbi:MAG: hypothetical protein QXQ53_04795 [Candidatus Methanosuratincola sp.]